MEQTATRPDVLTLEEAARYLQLTPEVVARQAVRGNIPGQWVEGSWRFLQATLTNWLRTRDYRAVLLQQAGTLANDDSLAELRAAIYQARGRPEVDTEATL